MKDVIRLWNTTAPFTDESPEQAQPTLTAFPVEGCENAVVVCPGGGYVMKAEHEGAPIAEMLNAHGIAAFVLDYRVTPCNCFAPLGDALRAIRTVRSMGYKKVGILGFSAGGHLACTAATMYADPGIAVTDEIDRHSARPDALIACYPVVSFASYTHVGSRMSLLRDKGEDPKWVYRFSNERNVTPDTPPAFIWTTSDDACVPAENSLMLADALIKNGVQCELHMYPSGVHGLGLAETFDDVSGWSDLCCAWLRRQGF